MEQRNKKNMQDLIAVGARCRRARSFTLCRTLPVAVAVAAATAVNTTLNQPDAIWYHCCQLPTLTHTSSRLTHIRGIIDRG